MPPVPKKKFKKAVKKRAAKPEKPFDCEKAFEAFQQVVNARLRILNDRITKMEEKNADR